MTRRIAALVLFATAMSCAKTPAPSTATAPTTTTTPAAPARAKDTSVGLGFVLLAKAELPDAAAVMAQYQRLAPDGPALASPDSNDTVHTFTHGGAVASVGILPMAVPDGEAEHHAQFSVMALAGSWKLRPHGAHLIVATMFTGGTPLERTRTAHRLIAAVAAAAGANAVGVYVGNAGVTHEPAFYIEAVAEEADPIFVWSGVSVARDDKRVSLLSMGMGQLGLPEIELTVETTPPGDALAAFYDLLLYAARRGERIPDGDTVGRDADQRIPVRYVPSPADPDVQVMRVDYP